MKLILISYLKGHSLLKKDEYLNNFLKELESDEEISEMYDKL